jgi:uncharacterized membrane protein YkoI
MAGNDQADRKVRAMTTRDHDAISPSHRDPPPRVLDRFVVAVALGLAVTAIAARADDDHHEARQAVAAGEVVPLEQLLARIREDFGGRALKVELEREDDDSKAKWVYEAKVLTAEGSVLKLDYDAKTLELQSLKGHYGRKHENDDD